MNKYVGYSIITLVLFVLVAIIGEMDYTNEVVEFNRYCSDVKDGVHPDYKQMNDKCE